MKLRIIAVGTRMPSWIEAGYHEYAKRMPRELPLLLTELKLESRILAALPERGHIVALDERGVDISTASLAQKLQAWMGQGEDVVFIVGGPDGLSQEIKQRADEMLRLSSLTLPHALVRVVLAEALYRAASLLKGHPYHRA